MEGRLSSELVFRYGRITKDQGAISKVLPSLLADEAALGLGSSS
jgi:hypothetical protein